MNAHPQAQEPVHDYGRVNGVARRREKGVINMTRRRARALCWLRCVRCLLTRIAITYAAVWWTANRGGTVGCIKDRIDGLGGTASCSSNRRTCTAGLSFPIGRELDAD
nr:unnamed protein product [Digitaria exilis]